MEDILAKYRKYQNNLIVGGSAIIVFGLWTIIKSILTYLFDKETVNKLYEALDLAEEMENLFFIICLAILLIDLFFRIRTGLTVKKLANNPKLSIRCLVFIVIFISICIYDIYDFVTGSMVSVSVVDSFASFIVECTVLFNFCEVLYSYIRLLLMQKKVNEG